MKRNITIFIIIISLIPTTNSFAQDSSSNDQHNRTFAEDTPELIPYRKGNKWGYCNREKNILLPVKYDYVERFSGGLAWVLLDGKYGYINMNGRETIPVKYDNVFSFINLFMNTD